MLKKDEMTLANQLCFSAYNVSRLFAQFYEQQLRPFGLTYSQYLVYWLYGKKIIEHYMRLVDNLIYQVIR